MGKQIITRDGRVMPNPPNEEHLPLPMPPAGEPARGMTLDRCLEIAGELLEAQERESENDEGQDDPEKTAAAVAAAQAAQVSAQAAQAAQQAAERIEEKNSGTSPGSATQNAQPVVNEAGPPQNPETQAPQRKGRGMLARFLLG